MPEPNESQDKRYIYYYVFQFPDAEVMYTYYEVKDGVSTMLPGRAWKPELLSDPNVIISNKEKDIIQKEEDARTTKKDKEAGGYNIEGGFGEAGLDHSQLKGKPPNEIFDILQGKGLIPKGDKIEDWIDDILDMPAFEDVSDEEKAEHEAKVEKDRYGLQTEIDRAQEDKLTAGDAYSLAEGRAEEDIAKSQGRLKLDLKDAGAGARSDIYGLQAQGAQQRRQGMFGKGMGGGMQALNQQDISSGMQRQGGQRMRQLGQSTRGLRQGASDYQLGIGRGLEDAGIARDEAYLGYDRTMEDATVDLYGVGGSKEGYDAALLAGQDYTGGIGGVYGTGGSQATGQYDLEQQANDEWESDTEGHIQTMLD